MAMTQAESALLRRTARMAFFDALDKPVLNLAGLLATEVPSDSDQESYAWLGNVPVVREFVGSRQAHALPTESFDIVNKEWELTLGFKRTTIEDGKLGQVELRIRDMAERANQHLDWRVTQTIVAGETGLCYDGQFYFDTDHTSRKAGAAARSNDLTDAAPVDPNRMTAAEAENVIQTVFEHFSNLRDDQDEPRGWGVDGITFMTHVNHLKAFRIALTQYQGTAADSSGVSGVWRGMASHMVNPYFTNTERPKIFAFKTNTEVKPLIYQSRLPIDITDNMGGDEDFNNAEVKFGTRARYETGFGRWENAVLITLS